MQKSASYFLKTILIFSALSILNCEQIRFEISQKDKSNDLKEMKVKWDQLHDEQMNYQSLSTSLSNFKNSQKQNIESQRFKNKFRSHFQFLEDPSTSKPNHGNSTSFSLYTHYGNCYLVTIYVGSERQEFQVLLDTGSSYTWLTQQNCSTCEDLNIVKYFDCEKSTTCANQHEDIQLVYGRGRAKATIYRDQIGFYHDKFIANNQDFLLVYELADLSFFPGHGLFGLGFSSMSDGRKTILDNLKEQGQLTKKQFAFSLSGDAEEVEFGMTNKDFFILGGDAVDPNLADDNDYFTCPVTYQPYWAVDVQGIKPIISDLEIDLHLSANIAIVDTGSSFIILNMHDFELVVNFFKKLQKLECILHEKYQLVNCKVNDYSVYPTFKFTLCEQSRHVLIYPQQYLLCDENECFVRISGMNFGFSVKKFVILGDIFMRTQYIVFNEDDMNISFYNKKNVKTDPKPSLYIKENLESSLKMSQESVQTQKKQKIKKGTEKINQKQKKQSKENKNEKQKLKKELEHNK